MTEIITKQNISSLRQDFPLLRHTTRGKPLVYLDSGATAQKPQCVIDAITHYYRHDNANVHRGVYELSQRATTAYENARRQVQQFINAQHSHEIIFTSGATAAINLVAQSYGRTFLQADDEILISTMEHHSNIVPWQLLCEQVGAKLKVIPLHDDGTLDLIAYKNLLTERVKFVAITHVSNVLGTINPVQEMIKLAHANHSLVLLDGAQAAPHLLVDVQALDCDFYTFSSHKMYGPTGVGILYGKSTLLQKMPPYQGGGDMIKTVSFVKTQFNELPYKFEAGTPNIAGVIGLGAAIQYLNAIGMEQIAQHEQALTHYATQALQAIPGLKIIGTAANKIGVISFVMTQAHAHDVGTIVDDAGVAIRVGHHCAMPLMERFQLAATARVSLGIYNNQHDIDALVHALRRVDELFGAR